MKQIALAKPDITALEKKYVNEVLDSGVLSIGPWIERFEEQIAQFVGVNHAIGVNSGTSGLHLLMRAFGIKKGDEVITTPFSFIASSNCILFEEAVPVFVDIDPDTYNMDLDQVERSITDKTRAIVAVDAFGQPADMLRLRKIADDHGLVLIEDACEALGSEYRGYGSGSLADGAVFAFYANKQITTAEGGMIVTNDGKAAELCRSMRSQGRAVTGLWLHHERLGYNYRLSEMHAALGAAQMERIDEILKQRKQVAAFYQQELGKVDWIRVPIIDEDVTDMSWFVYVVRVNKSIRNSFMDYLRSHGVGCKPYFTPIHLQPFYRDMGYKEGMYPETERAGEECVALPFYTSLSREDQQYVVDVIKAFER